MNESRYPAEDRQRQIDEFFVHIEKRLRRVAYCQADTAEEAEDLIQATRLKLLQILDKRPVGSIRNPCAYAVTVMKNIFNDQCQAKKKRNECSISSTIDREDGEQEKTTDLIDQQLFGEYYRDALQKRFQPFELSDFRKMSNRLPHDLKESFLMLIAGTSFDEMAEIIGKDREVVEARCKKAWSRFRYIFKIELQKRISKKKI